MGGIFGQLLMAGPAISGATGQFGWQQPQQQHLQPVRQAEASPAARPGWHDPGGMGDKLMLAGAMMQGGDGGGAASSIIQTILQRRDQWQRAQRIAAEQANAARDSFLAGSPYAAASSSARFPGARWPGPAGA